MLRDKLVLHDRFRATSLPVIPTYRPDEYEALCGVFPCISKPARGRSSQGLRRFESLADFESALPLDAGCIVQPWLDGEVVVADVLRSGPDAVRVVARRELLRTCNGAGLAVQILDVDPVLQAYVDELCRTIDVEGCVNIEFLRQRSGALHLMDVNPRFSAGVAFSGLAGYDFVRNHVRHHLGLPTESLGPIQTGAIYTRKYVEVIV